MTCILIELDNFCLQVLDHAILLLYRRLPACSDAWNWLGWGAGAGSETASQQLQPSNKLQPATSPQAAAIKLPERETRPQAAAIKLRERETAAAYPPAAGCRTAGLIRQPKSAHPAAYPPAEQGIRLCHYQVHRYNKDGGELNQGGRHRYV